MNEKTLEKNEYVKMYKKELLNRFITNLRIDFEMLSKFDFEKNFYAYNNIRSNMIAKISNLYIIHLITNNQRTMLLEIIFKNS